MTQQLSFPEPTTAGDLAPLTKIKHGEGFATVVGYIIPRDSDDSVLCRSATGELFEIAADAVVEVVEPNHQFAVYGNEDCAWAACKVCGQAEDDPDISGSCSVLADETVVEVIAS